MMILYYLLTTCTINKIIFVNATHADCWQLTRNNTGHIQPDPSKFPPPQQGEAMPLLGDHLHSKGL